MPYSGGDPLRDAFRNELDTIIGASSGTITWTQLDTVNIGARPSASDGYFEFEFPGGGEVQFTFGAPGNNLHREEGQVTLRAVVRTNAGLTERNKAESYMAAMRAAWRMRQFTTSAGRGVRITAVGAMGSGENEAGMWAESIGLAYETWNVG